LVLLVASTHIFAADESPSQKKLELLKAAYTGGRPVRVQFDQMSSVPASTPEDTLNAIRALPGLRTLSHPKSGQPLYALFSCEMTLDGQEGFRLVRLDRRKKEQMDADGAYELWNGDKRADFRHGMNGVADLYSRARRSSDETRKATTAGRRTADRSRGEHSPLHLVRWAINVLEGSQDLEETALDGQRVRLSSKSDNMELVYDIPSGEVRAVRFQDRVGDVYSWWWEGAIAGAAYPARHPEFQFHSLETTTPGGAQSVLWGDAMWCTAVTVGEPVDASLFDWRTVAEFAYDNDLKAVIDRHGTVDKERTQLRHQMQPPTGVPLPADSTVGQASPQETSPLPKALIGSVIGIAILGALWWRFKGRA
jgi:hypothetical protein